MTKKTGGVDDHGSKNMNKVVEEWLRLSEYDLQTAEAMVNSGRYLYVAFMCQQAVEKILKAIYCHTLNVLPPRTHNLLYLVDLLKLEMSESEKIFLSQLNQFYLENRYPDAQGKLAKEMDKEKGQIFLKKTGEVWTCLRQTLP